MTDTTIIQGKGVGVNRRFVEQVIDWAIYDQGAELTYNDAIYLFESQGQPTMRSVVLVALDAVNDINIDHYYVLVDHLGQPARIEEDNS